MQNSGTAVTHRSVCPSPSKSAAKLWVLVTSVSLVVARLDAAVVNPAAPSPKNIKLAPNLTDTYRSWCPSGDKEREGGKQAKLVRHTHIQPHRLTEADRHTDTHAHAHTHTYARTH